MKQNSSWNYYHFSFQKSCLTSGNNPYLGTCC